MVPVEDVLELPTDKSIFKNIRKNIVKETEDVVVMLLSKGSFHTVKSLKTKTHVTFCGVEDPIQENLFEIVRTDVTIRSSKISL
jgi:ABC-type uncharacterized transport system substrate-binding protein